MMIKGKEIVILYEDDPDYKTKINYKSELDKF